MPVAKKPPKPTPKAPTSLGAILHKGGAKPRPKLSGPLWGGPEQDGITFSLLSRFLVCRERFRCLVVRGIVPFEAFNPKTEFGQMWHLCEEAHAGCDTSKYNRDYFWQQKLKDHCRKLCQKYPTQQKEVDKWYSSCLVQFPVYLNFWSKHKDVVKRQPLLQERVFEVPYDLPSGRMVLLRGKWDSVDLVPNGDNAGVWLQENKTKGNPKEEQLRRQLKFDLQTMLYLVALHTAIRNKVKFDDMDDRVLKILHGQGGLRGVRYNVIRRPHSGGKGAIRQKKPSKANPKGESRADYFKRLGGIMANNPAEFFMRWNVHVPYKDVQAFERRTLIPILESLCDWWTAINYDMKSGNMDWPAYAAGKGLHWQHPFGVWNVLDEGGATHLDDYLLTGSEVGLERTDNLFPELTEAA